MLAVENTWCPRGLFSAKIPGGNKRLVRFMFAEKKKKEQLDWNKFGAAASGWVGGWGGEEQEKIQIKFGGG